MKPYSLTRHAEFSTVEHPEPLRCLAMLDTGAQKTCLPESMAVQLQIHPTRSATFATVGGMSHVQFGTVNIRFSGSEFPNHEVAIFPSLRSPLIGIDILTASSLLVSSGGLLFGQAVHLLGALSSFKQQCVLILGQDTTEMYRLVAIRGALRDLGYFGLIVKEIDDIEVQSTEEKVNMLASLCRFIICDNSVTSGHIDELKICAVNRFVTATLQQDGMGATWMQADYPLDFGFMQTFRYPAASEIASAVKLAVEWADKKVEERKEFFNKLYHWRK